MNDAPLYNSRLIKNYLEYLSLQYPEVDQMRLLEYAGITSYQVEDAGHWLSQRQIDLFHESMTQQTGDPGISRDVGRYSTFSKVAIPIRQYILGFMTPTVAYSVIGKLYGYLSRACTIQAINRGANSVEVIAKPNPGVEEKLFQCENRMGILEAMAEYFESRFVGIEHPACVHRGDDCCRYIVRWEKTSALLWKRIRNYFVGSTLIVCPALFLLIREPRWVWTVPALLYVSIVLFFLFYSEHVEKKELSLNLKNHSDLANDLLDETNIRYNNAMLVQEIGQVTASILDREKLLELVIEVMVKRLEFDRGIIMLTNRDKSHLVYTVGYGYNPDQEDFLAGIEFNLGNPDSKGPAVESFRLQKPILIEDIAKIETNLSKRSFGFAQAVGAHSFICVPIIFERQSLGIIMVDNIKSRRNLKQSDVNLLMGIATQIAISMNNAASYEKVRENEERFRSLSENAPDIIYTIDVNGVVTYINPAWERILGHRIEEVFGQRFANFIYKKDAASYAELFDEIKRDKIMVSDRAGTILHKDGSEKIFNISAAPNLDLDGNVMGIVGIFKDISEQKKLESQLLHAQKMEAVGTLAGGIAHDFNNLLTGIQGYVSLLQLDVHTRHPLYEKIKGIEDQVRSGAELTKQLLGFARGGRFEAVVADVNEIIERTSSMFGRTKKEISIHRKLDESLWSVEIDRGQIEQVLLNIYVNAWQAMPFGGDLYLESARVLLDEEFVKPFAILPGRYVRLSVTDTGIGMDEKTKERIFEPFFTTKEVGRGTGLGLASAYGIIKGHNGIIDVQSEKGQGTTFTIYLPASDKEPVIEDGGSSDLVKGEGTILLVDDEEVIIEVGGELLQMLGYQVAIARSGREAVAIYKQRGDEIDMVILDMIMPDMDGAETFNVLKSIDPGVRVILSSGYSADARMNKMMEQGCGFIQKPYRVNTLSQKINEALHEPA